MKKLYCLVMTEFDEICGNRELEELHTTNKKRLESLATKLNKKVNRDHYNFYVREILPKENLTKEDVLKGIDKFERYISF